MNISDFLTTVFISLLVGIIIGYVLRNIQSTCYQLYSRYCEKTHYFKQDTLFSDQEGLKATNSIDIIKNNQKKSTKA